MIHLIAMLRISPLHHGMPPSSSQLQHYDYLGADGQRLYTVVRDGHGRAKRFSYLDATGSPNDSIPRPWVLYRLPELLRSAPTRPVLIAEGEKDVETLVALGYTATTNPGGCGLGWQPEYAAHFQGRIAIILPDHDQPGQMRAIAIHHSLRGTVSGVAILRLPRLRGAEDVTDWLERRGGTLDELRRLVEAAMFEAAGVADQPRDRQQRELIVRSALSPTQKLVLLVLQHRRQSAHSAIEIAADAGMHRVSVHRILVGLRQRGILHDWAVNWPEIAARRRVK